MGVPSESRSPSGSDHRFVSAVAASLAAALLAGATSVPPSGGPPGYALESSLVYRVEIGLVVFVVLYAVVVLVRLAAHGLTPSRVGTGAVDLPQLMETFGTVSGELGAGSWTDCHRRYAGCGR
jgi:hypothetical protein